MNVPEQHHEPTLTEIRRECQNIRRCWSAAERSRRKLLAEMRMNRLWGSIAKDKNDTTQTA